MKTTKRILLIDDENQSNDIESIKLKLKGIVNVIIEQIEVFSEQYLDDDSYLDEEKLFAALKEKLKSHIDLILVDYDYGEAAKINGIDVIRKIRETKKNPIILYSADQKKVLYDIISHQNLTTENINQIVNNINEFIRLGISKISRRDSYVSDVISFLKSDINPSPLNSLSFLLREHGEKVFNSCCPRLAGKKFSELADILEEENNGAGHEWIDAVNEQLLSYLSNINE